jgi:hypothetical protein
MINLKMNEDYENIKRIAEELRICACSWEPNAKLLGNVSAKDIEYLCDYLIYEEQRTLKELAQPPTNSPVDAL